MTEKENINQSLPADVASYKDILKSTDIQNIYMQLMKYVQRLKTQLSKDLEEDFLVGNVFQGYMDYTYFYLTNPFLQSKKLKLGIVFNHKNTNFEIWLLGQTKDIQEKYWKLLQNTMWITSQEIPKYSIFEVVLVENPDFNDLDQLTKTIKTNFVSMATDISSALKKLARN